MPWRLSVTRSAERDLDTLSTDDRGRVEAALQRLADDPGSVDFTKLRANQWRMRVGRWRVMLELNSRDGTMYVTAVRPRNEQTYR